MKYILIIGDGMADNPVQELGGRTPLEAADKPCIDQLAKKGAVGSVLTVPAGQPPGSDTAILSIFGCDPERYYTGRSPLEAAGSGVSLSHGDVSFRCNMVTYEDSDAAFEDKAILSHSAGSIEGGESIEIVKALFEDEEFNGAAQKAGLTVYPSPSFRHIAVQKSGDALGLTMTPPHDILGRTIGQYRSSGNENAEVLWRLMALANKILDRLPQNEKRRRQGKLPANGIWFWAEGTSVKLPDFVKSYGKTGSVISAVPLVHGIGALTGLKPVHVEGATGETETNYEGKVQAAVDCLKNGDDFVCVHIEAPDEATHNGNLEEKLLSIGYLDSRVTKPLVEALDEYGKPYRILMLSDHKTLMSTRTHDGDPVPCLFYDSRRDTGNGLGYTEKIGEAGYYIEPGTRLMEILFSDNLPEVNQHYGKV